MNQARLSSVIAPAPTAGTANSESARGGMRLARQAREIRQWRSVCTMLCGDPTHPDKLTWTAGIRRCSTQSEAAATQRQGPLLGLKVGSHCGSSAVHLLFTRLRPLISLSTTPPESWMYAQLHSERSLQPQSRRSHVANCGCCLPLWSTLISSRSELPLASSATIKVPSDSNHAGDYSGSARSASELARARHGCA